MMTASDADLTINTDLAAAALSSFIRDETTKFGIQKVVVGLSGGIDSALSTYLAARALGPEKVLAVMMPYRTSAAESLSDAQAVIDALGLPSRRLEITAAADAFIEREPEMSRLRRGNIMARLRMVTLYDQSEAWGPALVLGTSNKTEALVGYTTIYGDAAAALQPIADLYKTQVRQLSRALGVPAGILDKPPSADLWPGQTDEQEMGFSYEELDQVLYLLVDGRLSVEEVIARGWPAAFVREVWRRVARASYKRRMPPIAKVSLRAIEQDFLYPRDWGR
jgi:NAD+ synthase